MFTIDATKRSEIKRKLLFNDFSEELWECVTEEFCSKQEKHVEFGWQNDDTLAGNSLGEKRSGFDTVYSMRILVSETEDSELLADFAVTFIAHSSQKEMVCENIIFHPYGKDHIQVVYDLIEFIKNNVRVV